jgi:hypothetical protein
MRDAGTSRRSLPGRVIVFSFASPILSLTYAATARAQGQVQGPMPAAPAGSPSPRGVRPHSGFGKTA